MRYPQFYVSGQRPIVIIMRLSQRQPQAQLTIELWSLWPRVPFRAVQFPILILPNNSCHCESASDHFPSRPYNFDGHAAEFWLINIHMHCKGNVFAVTISWSFTAHEVVAATISCYAQFAVSVTLSQTVRSVGAECCFSQVTHDTSMASM